MLLLFACKHNFHFQCIEKRISIVYNFSWAKAQSFHYCMAMVEGTNSNHPILTMPCTPTEFNLYLCIPESTPQMAYIKIMEAKVDNTKDLALFFAE